MLAALRSAVRAITGRRTLEGDMDEEMRFHMEAYEADLLKCGVPAVEASRRARAEFGSVQEFKDECREARGLYWVDELGRNVRYAFRMLAKSPAFTATAVVTLGLCIGANTAIFSIADAVLFRPLPFPEPDRLGEFVTYVRTQGSERMDDSQDGTAWQALKRATHIDVAATGGAFTGVNLATQNHAMYVHQQRVTAGYFRILGIPPEIGRDFTESEDRAGGPQAVILSHSIWANAFGSDPAIAGKQILLRGEPHIVVGVASPKFRPVMPADVWTPLRPSTTGEGEGQNYAIVARLRPGATWPEANAEVRSLERIALSNWHLPAGRIAQLRLQPLQRALGAFYQKPLFILLAAVAIVLLIGCVNIAGLALARAAKRRREIGTRLALGGGHGAVMRQLLTESMVLALLGGFVGVALGYVAIQGLNGTLEQFGIWQEVRLDGRVLAIALFASLTTSILFGLAPAWQAARLDIRSALSEGGSRGIAGGRKHWMRRSLVVAQVALGLVLLVGAGLLLRTLLNLQQLSPGFDPNDVLTASLSLQDARYEHADRIATLFDRTLESIRTTPGVESAAVALHLPYERWLNCGVRMMDGADSSRDRMTTANYVTSEYFHTLRIPLRAGRWFDSRDQKRSAPVAIVNDAFARKYFKDSGALGRHVRLSMDGITREVIGIAGDFQQRQDFTGFGSLGRDPAVFIPVSQVSDAFVQGVHVWFAPKWIVRSAGSRGGLIASMQRAVEAADPLLPFAKFQTMQAVRDETFGWQRATAVLLGSIAGLALLLAAIGIYGLIANSVAERTREMGIRMTLGATLGDVMVSSAGPGVILTVAGIVVGSVLAVGAVGFLRSLLYAVKPLDPITFASVACVLLVVAALASLVPALRLGSLDPSRTLRDE
jgi:predicted permease